MHPASKCAVNGEYATQNKLQPIAWPRSIGAHPAWNLLDLNINHLTFGC